MVLQHAGIKNHIKIISIRENPTSSIYSWDGIYGDGRDLPNSVNIRPIKSADICQQNLVFSLLMPSHIKSPHLENISRWVVTTLIGNSILELDSKLPHEIRVSRYVYCFLAFYYCIFRAGTIFLLTNDEVNNEYPRYESLLAWPLCFL